MTSSPKVPLERREAPFAYIELIVANIFQHLKSQDLNSCAQVCRLWHQEVEREMKRRRDVFPFFWGMQCQEPFVHRRCAEFCRQNTRNIESDIRRVLEGRHLQQCVPLIFTTHQVREDTEGLFSNVPRIKTPEYIRIKNKDSLNFSCSTEFEEYYGIKEALRAALQAALRRLFPQSLQLILSIAPVISKIIGCTKDLMLQEAIGGYVMTGVIIPQYPGFEIHNFEFRRYRYLNTIPRDANIKCLLVFSPVHVTFNRVMAFLNRRRIYDIAIGGYSALETDVPPNGSVVAFCGENVTAASLVINPWDADSHRRLQLFHEAGLVVDKCFAFVFHILNDKLEEMNDRLNNTFRELYPDVPLCGLYARQLLGVEYLPGIGAEDREAVVHDKSFIEKKSNYMYGEYMDHDRSVFIFLSIKP